MLGDNLSKADRLELAIHALNQALQKLNEHNYLSAQARVSLARQVLEELQLDFDLHFQVEELLGQLLQ